MAPHWLLAALCGAMLAGLLWAVRPYSWVSTAYLTMRPLIEREGHWLTIDELGGAYTYQLLSDEMLSQVAESTNRTESPAQLRPAFDARYEGKGIWRIRAIQPTPTQAEQLAATLQRTAAETITAQNRQRIDIDRIEVTRSAITLPTTTRPPLAEWLLVGALGGAALSLPLLFGREHRRGRCIVTPLQAEQVVAVPTLAAIPVARHPLRIANRE